MDSSDKKAAAAETEESYEGTGETAKEESTPEERSGKGTDAPEELTEQERLLRENAELRDNWLRTAADFDNFRKRSSRERQREIEYARTAVLLPLFEVLDDLERALHQEGAEDEDFRRGVEMIREKFVNQLASIGVVPLETAGASFDPECMEALAMVPSPDAEANRVIGEIRKGYRLGERVIRPAQVSVAAPAADRESDRKKSKKDS